MGIEHNKSGTETINNDQSTSQHWLQIMLSTTPETSDDIVDVLSEAGAIAVTLQDCADEPIYEPLPGEQRLWSQTRVIGLFEADTRVDDLLHHLKMALKVNELPNCMVKHLANQDWERVWIDHFKPMQFGDKLWVCPTAHTPPDPDAINLMLDPGLAFGTGTHATTAQCLEALPHIDVTNKNVLDYGCGSGILAIAAARLGAASVWAIDIDEQALLATTENALRNNVETYITSELPDGLPENMHFDILLANILSGPLIELAPYFATRLKPEGTLILSGILTEQTNKVCQAYNPWFKFDEPRQRDNWTCLTARRLDNLAPNQ